MASHHAGLVLLQLSRRGMLRTVDRAHVRALEERVLQGLHNVQRECSSLDDASRQDPNVPLSEEGAHLLRPDPLSRVPLQ